MVFGQFWVSWGLVLPPPLQKKGAWQPGSFYTPYHKTACYGGILGLFFGQEYCNLSCCKLASKQNSDFMEKCTKPCKLRGKTQFWQKAARDKIQPNRIFYWFFTVKSHFAWFILKNSFCVESNKTLQNCS